VSEQYADPYEVFISKRSFMQPRERNARSVKDEQQFQWNKESETDTPQAEAHQPYRSREKDSTSNTDSKTQQRKAKKAPREQDGD
jgi:hypothetical protein